MALIKSRKINDPALKLAGDPAPEMLVTVTDQVTGKTRSTELQNAVKYSGISLSSGIIGQADKTTVPDDSTNKFIKYSIPNDEDHVGIYPNFLDALGNPLEVVDDDPENEVVGDLSKGIVEFWGQNNVWRKNITGLPLSGFTKTGGYYGTAQDLLDDQVKNYQFKYFIQDVQVPNMTVNGTPVTDDFEKKKILIRIEQAITKFETFNLPKDKCLILSQFTFGIGANISLGISITDSEDQVIPFSQSYTKFFQTLPAVGKPRFAMSIAAGSFHYNLLIDIDTSVLGTDTISFNTQNEDSNVSYKWSGINRQAIPDNYKPKAIWGREFIMSPTANNESNRTDNMNVYNAVQEILVRSNDTVNDRLLSIRQCSYTSGKIMFIMWSCIDDDPNNLSITTDRNGFRYHRLAVDPTDTGVRRYESYAASGTGDPEILVTMVIDVDKLFNSIVDLTKFDARTSSTALAQYLVKKKISGSVNPDGHFTQLSLLSSEDIEIYKWSWNSGGTNYKKGTGNKYKLCAIPEGLTNLVFNGTLDGASSNVLMYDKDFHAIGFVYDGGNGTINSLTYVPPANAAFFRVICASEMEVLANGDFTINTTSIKEYRSIHAGLADKYSGKVFGVGGRLFWKEKDGICDLREYSTSDDGYLKTLPTLISDNTLIVPTNVMHTDGVTPFNGGYLCNVKDGVMYFQNEHEQAVFISEDDGESYTTLFDSFSHPDIFNLGAGELSLANGRPGIIVMNNGELLIPIKSAGGLIDDPRKERREVYYRIYRTINNRSDLVQCFKYSYESSLNDWDPAKPLWGNWVTGGILSKYSYDTLDNLVVITEYGTGTPLWWAAQGIDKNGNGVVGRAWISFDYGVTFKKFFDADRKKVGTEVNDDNWFYWNSTYNRMQMHPHSIRIDKTRRMIAICNGDGDDFIFEVSIDAAKAWYDTAPTVDPGAKPVYAETDTFPEWSLFQTNYDSKDPRIFVSIYAGMTGQLMSVASTGFGYACMHDARRDALFARYKNGFGEDVFEPVFWFEQMEDYPTQEDWIASWVTEAFVQDDPKHEGIIYMVHTGGNGRPARIWATVNGITCKKLYEGTGLIGFGGALNFDRGKIYLSPKVGATSVEDGYYRFTQVPA